MSDLISRSEVIKAVDRHLFDTDNGLCLDDDITCILEEVPSAEPAIEKLTCAGCKWEFEIAKECEECARVMTDNYKEAKKKLTFSERQKIVREYNDWRLFNNAADCAESFLAYLCIKGFIDG